MQQAEPGRRIVPAETLEKRQCLVRFFTSLASATFLAERKRVSKGTIRRPGSLGTIPHAVGDSGYLSDFRLPAGKSHAQGITEEKRRKVKSLIF